MTQNLMKISQMGRKDSYADANDNNNTIWQLGKD